MFCEGQFTSKWCLIQDLCIKLFHQRLMLSYLIFWCKYIITPFFFIIFGTLVSLTIILSIVSHILHLTTVVPLVNQFLYYWNTSRSFVIKLLYLYFLLPNEDSMSHINTNMLLSIYICKWSLLLLFFHYYYCYYYCF